MILRLNFKTPDVLDNAIDEALENIAYNADKDEDDYMRSHEADALRAICTRWVKYGESVTIEIDTEEETARVIKR